MSVTEQSGVPPTAVFGFAEASGIELQAATVPSWRKRQELIAYDLLSVRQTSKRLSACSF